MYLTEVWLEHIGPIDKCHIIMPFSDQYNPLPVVLVGPNGSGKTILLSYIVDALFEFAKTAYRDFVARDFENPNPYFRVVAGTNIQTGSLYSLALLQFKEGDQFLNYREKAGSLDPAEYEPSIKQKFANMWSWPKDENSKSVTQNNNLMKEAFDREAVCFFPTSRNEAPEWLNPYGRIQPRPHRRGLFSGQLEKPLYIETCAEENTRWILDVFLDFLVDLTTILKQRGHLTGGAQQLGATHQFVDQEWLQNFILLSQARQNVERILQEILQDPGCQLILNLRQITPSRLSIKMSDGRTIPSLQALSAGQSLLFNLFVTIIRYADQSDINLSIRLEDITGIVIIDEVDAHLHTILQHDCLPRLLSLFPKVQFFLSSHAPIFLLGMETMFGQDGFHLIEMPTGTYITTEKFAEFSASFEHYTQTERFEDEIKKRLSAQQKPLVLTEGQLDPRYIRTALELLGEEKFSEVFDIEFVGLDDTKGGRHGGKSGLDHFRNTCEANPWLIHRKNLLLYDCDSNKQSEVIGDLHIRAIPQNQDDCRAQVGIENLFPAHLFESRFYKHEEKQGNYGERNSIERFDKSEFCRWICEERRSPDDFKNFVVVIQILKEFTEANSKI